MPEDEEEQEEEEQEEELSSQEKKDVLESLVDEINQQAEGIKFLDTGFIIDDAFDSVYIVDGKVKFAPMNSNEYHDLDWAVQRSNVMDLYNVLLTVKMLLPSFKNVKQEDDRELLNRLLG
jgi:acid phosphatase class B